MGNGLLGQHRLQGLAKGFPKEGHKDEEANEDLVGGQCSSSEAGSPLRQNDVPHQAKAHDEHQWWGKCQDGLKGLPGWDVLQRQQTLCGVTGVGGV